MKSTAANDRVSDPKHTIRATRTAGRRMRSRLLDAASRLFKEQGLAAVSIADIAARADAFPSQITYYFRTCSSKLHAVTCFTWRVLPKSMLENNSHQMSIPAHWLRA